MMEGSEPRNSFLRDIKFLVGAGGCLSQSLYLQPPPFPPLPTQHCRRSVKPELIGSKVQTYSLITKVFILYEKY